MHSGDLPGSGDKNSHGNDKYIIENVLLFSECSNKSTEIRSLYELPVIHTGISARAIRKNDHAQTKI